MSDSSELLRGSSRSLGRAEVIATLRQGEAELRRLGVQRLFLFGSTARNEAGDDSDVDLFFDYEKGRFGLFELMDVKERVSQILGRKADIMTRDSLHKTLRQRIEATAIPVF
jgi:predicted nucleotidyltransferase